MKILVAGLGSPVGDDRIGWQVVEALGKRSDLPDDVTVVALPHPMALAPLLQEADRALIIDAVVTGGTPGELHEFDLKKVPPPARISSSSHGTDLAEVIALVERVGRLPRELRLLGVEIGSDSCPPGVAVGSAALGMGLDGVAGSELVAKVIDQTRRVVQIMRSHSR
ncbi:MAG: hydrogenase maturation protease [Pseudomonadota bacterium]|nr:hydrogenase maturation protease [Pseudomonadota bacterium]